jgi:hypothetical protein
LFLQSKSCRKVLGFLTGALGFVVLLIESCDVPSRQF